MNQRPVSEIGRLQRTAKNLIVFGLVIVSVAFVLFLTINGASEVSALLLAFTVILIAVGLFGSASGLFLLAWRGPFPIQARRGLALQGVGFASLFFGIILAAASSALIGFVIGAVVIAASTSFALVGKTLFGMGFANKHSLHGSGRRFILLGGLILLFLGAALIIAFNILGLTYYLSNLDALIYEDIGATMSAYGSLIGAYLFLRVL